MFRNTTSLRAARSNPELEREITCSPAMIGLLHRLASRNAAYFHKVGSLLKYGVELEWIIYANAENTGPVSHDKGKVT
jgi:hypothetical protein